MEKNKTRKVFKVNANIFTICMTGVVAVVVIGKVKENVTLSLHFPLATLQLLLLLLLQLLGSGKRLFTCCHPPKRSNREPIIDQQRTNGRSA